MPEDQAPPAVDHPDAAPAEAPSQDQLNAAVQKALDQGAARRIEIAPCMCGANAPGTPPVDLTVRMQQGSQVARASCSGCGVWGVDFLVPQTNNQELVAVAAAKAWNEAPRNI